MNKELLLKNIMNSANIDFIEKTLTNGVLLKEKPVHKRKNLAIKNLS